MKAKLNAKGELYQEFKETLYYEDISNFINEQISSCKDQTVKKTLEGKYDEAKVYAHMISGLKLVTDYIEDCIQGNLDAKEAEQADKDYVSEIRTHV